MMAQPASALWGGSRLRRWLVEGGPPEHRSPLRSRARALAFDAALALQRRLPAASALPPDEPPLFILGFWRSGTTLLHELVAALPGMAAPRTWHCFNPATLRLTQTPAAATTSRPMDGMAITTHGPQEDEFALLLMGAQSLYRGFLDPRRLDTLTPLLDGADGARWLEAFEPFAGAVRALGPGRLVVKSPTHLFRQAALRQRWPAAPLLVPVRDAHATWVSAQRMWAMMVDQHGLWRAPDGAIASFMLRALDAAARHLDALAEAARAGAPIAACRFDALAASPAAATGALLARVGFAPGPEGSAALAAAATRHAGRPRTRAEAPHSDAAHPALAAYAAAGERLLAAAGV